MDLMDMLDLIELEGTVVNYDQEADVLYISFGPPQPAICIEPEEGLVLRLDPETDQLVGITIVGARALLRDQPGWHPAALDNHPAIWDEACQYALA